MEKMTRRFSLPWAQQSPELHTAGNYTISKNGKGWELRYRGTLLHSGFTLTECKAEADRHRGISNPGGRA